jgi:Ribosomal protein S1
MEQDKALTCQVLACRKGGYTVSVLGSYAFLPNSLAHYKKSHTPERVLGKQLKVHIRKVKNSQFMVSHKEFLEEA